MVAPQSQPKISETRQHSPLPYRISRGEIFDADGEVVGEIFRTEAWSDGEPVKSEDQATAAFIVEAVNNHVRLTERCEQYKGQVKAGSDEIDRLTAEIEALRARNGELEGALMSIKKLKPEPVADGFVTGPQALLDAAKRVARAALQPKPADETGRVG